jgi:GntP family gluconate:H+ symporter
VGLPVIVLSYLISVVLRVAQGSATVAIVTTAGIVAPLLTEGDHSQPFVALVILAISAGSIFASRVNDGARARSALMDKAGSSPSTSASVNGTR